MKKLIALAAGCICAASLLAQESADYSLTIRAKNAKPTDKAFIYYQKNHKMVIDSLDLVNGSAVMKGQTEHMYPAYVYIEPGNSNFGKKPNSHPGQVVYIEKGNIVLEILGGDNGVKISGTPTNNDYTEFQNKLLPFKKREAQMETLFTEAKNKNDNAAMERLKTDYQNMMAERTVAEKEFFNTHLDSEVSLDWLNTTIDVANNKTEATELFNKLSERVRNSYNGVRYTRKLGSVVSVGIGDMAPALTAQSLTGEQVSLTDFKGKYVLLDFWASWCMPCRQENPNVVKAYQKYKSDKFEILGFSLDENKMAWSKAVETDGLSWKHISDLSGWQSSAVYTFAVRAVPANFLIDPTGKIIAKNLRGEELAQKLSEIFKK